MSNLLEVLKSGEFSLIDVREPLELMTDGEITGATNIPLGTVPARKDEILNIAGPVILFCRSGNRSGKALEYLQSEGLQKGYNGGGWQELKNLMDSI